jgi:hypothetical protein
MSLAHKVVVIIVINEKSFIADNSVIGLSNVYLNTTAKKGQDVHLTFLLEHSTENLAEEIVLHLKTNLEHPQ